MINRLLRPAKPRPPVTEKSFPHKRKAWIFWPFIVSSQSNHKRPSHRRSWFQDKTTAL